MDLKPDAQMLPIAPVVANPRAEMGRRQKALTVNRAGFPAAVDDTGDQMGGTQRTRSPDLQTALEELTNEIRELKEWMMENMK